MIGDSTDGEEVLVPEAVANVAGEISALGMGGQEIEILLRRDFEIAALRSSGQAQSEARRASCRPLILMPSRPIFGALAGA